jgi:L-2-hydroxycarboxylate dehydrogenase (NAD+)
MADRPLEKTYTANYPPKHGIRVPAEALQRLVCELFLRADVPPQDAELLARLLVENDLRCIFSHGTYAAVGYVRLMLAGRVNPKPKVRIVEESATTLVMDGDGGLGYLPCHRGTELAIAKAREFGTAAMTSRNHHHFGAAGIYSRMAVAHHCIGLAVSADRCRLEPEEPISQVHRPSPISIAVPAGAQPPLIFDMATPNVPELFEHFPSAYFKLMGLTTAIHALGGIMAGMYLPHCRKPQSKWLSNQGAFVAIFDVARFMPVEQFKQAMDRYIGAARATQPMPGTEHAELAGGREWGWRKANQEAGIPISRRHAGMLARLAAKLGVATAFEAYEATRF